MQTMLLLEQRPPSMNWEPILLDPSGQFVVWVWFRPAAVPTGLMFVISASLFTDVSVSSRLSIRQLVVAAGLDPSQILIWTLNGMTFDSAGGVSPLLDQILPPPATGANLDVSVWFASAQQPMWSGFPTAAAGFADFSGGQPAYANSGLSQNDGQLLDAIESTWNAVLNLETRVTSIRKDLASSISRINSLNRDLSSDERRTCDSKDLQEWNDARRWLRDSHSVLSRSVKEIDVGTTSSAGKRLRFEEIYRNQVVPRVSFPGLMQAVNEFESYRKILQSVLASAQASISKAGRDAEQRANSVLHRVAAKMRASRR